MGGLERSVVVVEVVEVEVWDVDDGGRRVLLLERVVTLDFAREWVAVVVVEGVRFGGGIGPPDVVGLREVDSVTVWRRDRGVGGCCSAAMAVVVPVPVPVPVRLGGAIPDPSGEAADLAEEAPGNCRVDAALVSRVVPGISPFPAEAEETETCLVDGALPNLDESGLVEEEEEAEETCPAPVPVVVVVVVLPPPPPPPKTPDKGLLPLATPAARLSVRSDTVPVPVEDAPLIGN